MVLPGGWWRRCKLEKLLGGGAGIGLGIMGRDAGFEGVGGLEGRGRKSRGEERVGQCRRRGQAWETVVARAEERRVQAAG